MIKVLFVCMGNICRSPTAEAVFRATVEKAGLAHFFEIDSAGTENYHVGECADERSIEQAARCGYDLRPHIARQVNQRDYAHYDFILVMDDINMHALTRRAPSQYQSKGEYFMAYGSDPKVRFVPDPYYGGVEGFKKVIALCEDASRGLLDHIKKSGRLQA
ncbi:MAG: low molecular weight phosphotyrosine protein phosphatase [Burkholderiaceae bacterium]|nr:low molecular weight phosphotyrosine protein phosphatase [Burkholderiaceae bacterium]